LARPQIADGGDSERTDMSMLYTVINHQVSQTHTNFPDLPTIVSFLIRTVFFEFLSDGQITYYHCEYLFKKGIAISDELTF